MSRFFVNRTFDAVQQSIIIYFGRIANERTVTVSMDDNQLPDSSIPSRKYLTAEEKFKIIKEQLTTKTGMTEICKKYGINATQFYRWQEQFFEGAARGLEAAKRSGQSNGELVQAQKVIEERDRKIARQQEVILEIASENVTLKKNLGEWSPTK